MKSVKVSELKAKLSYYLRMVKQGQEITVTDRRLPIARLTGITGKQELHISSAQMSLSQALQQMPKLKHRPKTDSLALLLEDRERR